MPPLNGVALEDSSLPASTDQWGMWVDGPFTGQLASWRVGHSEALGSPFGSVIRDLPKDGQFGTAIFIRDEIGDHRPLSKYLLVA